MVWLLWDDYLLQTQWKFESHFEGCGRGIMYFKSRSYFVKFDVRSDDILDKAFIGSRLVKCWSLSITSVE